MHAGRQPVIPDDAWYKSSYSSAGATECVEAALLPCGTAVRDSKNRANAPLRFSGEAWMAFTKEIREGRISLSCLTEAEQVRAVVGPTRPAVLSVGDAERFEDLIEQYRIEKQARPV